MDKESELVGIINKTEIDEAIHVACAGCYESSNTLGVYKGKKYCTRCLEELNALNYMKEKKNEEKE
jgi:hypothetical protein